MPCYTPLTAYRTRNGISFQPNCEDNLHPIKLPCGSCVGCRMEYARQWSIRCVHEASLHEKNCFLTLTLNDDHVSSNYSLDKNDFPLFMKRLRKKYSFKKYGKIGYYMCGEYGENFSRPHYHACLFNFDFPDKIEIQTSKSGHRQFTSKILDSLWQNGHATIGDVTPESAAYVARYVTKKIRQDNDNYYGSRVPEYTTCSRRPAIGLKWVEKYHSDIYNNDVLIFNEHKVRPPRFYDKVYEKNFPEKFLDIKAKREESQLLKNRDDESPERMNVKHKIAVLNSQKEQRSFECQSPDKQTYAQVQNYDNKVINYNEEILYET